jgi:cytochrome c peroxidase
MTNRKMLACSVAVAAVLVLIALVGTVAAQNPALAPKEELGKAIFFDKNLSINRNQSCAICHGPDVGFTGPDEAINKAGGVYEGSIAGRFGNRKPPSSAYATFSPIFTGTDGTFVGGNFWDGRATGMKLGNPAADQAGGPPLNPAEMGMPDAACIVYRVCTASAYPVSFDAVWGAGACTIKWPADVDAVCSKEGGQVTLSAADKALSDKVYGNIALSIAAYEASAEVNSFTSKYDYVLQGKATLTTDEQEGLALFEGKGKCSTCHISTGKQPLFTDFTYDNLGIPKNLENPATKADPKYVDPGLGGYLKNSGAGAEVVQAQMGMFKVPTLRNVDKRPQAAFVKAFGHNGYFKSLEEIVHFYNTRDAFKAACEATTNPKPGVNCWPAPEEPANVNKTEIGNLGLAPDQEADIVAFLKTLSDGYKP